MLKKVYENKLDLLLDSLVLDIPFDVSNPENKDKLVDIITKTILELFTIWWSIQEIIEFIQNKRKVKDDIRFDTSLP